MKTRNSLSMNRGSRRKEALTSFPTNKVSLLTSAATRFMGSTRECFRGLLCLAATLALLVSAAVAGQVSLDSAPPVVVNTFPAAGSTNVDPALTEIRITYSKPMSGRTWSWFTHKNLGYPQMLGDPKLSGDKKTFVRKMQLEPGKLYGLWFNRSDSAGGILDASGIAAVPYLLTFSTAGAALEDQTTVAASPRPSLATWLKEAGIDLDQVDLQTAPLTQVMIEELQPDGTSHFRSVIRTVNRSSEPQTKLQFMNSDIVELQRIVDVDGNAIPFTTVHRDRRFHYSATLPTPVPPGGTLIYGNEGTVRGKVFEEAGLGTFTYRFTHSPGGSGAATRRVEVHRLPAGAELIELSPNATQRDVQGRTEIVLDELIRSRGNVTLEYRYRLPGTKQIVQSAVTAISRCAEGDPRVRAALQTLAPLEPSQVVAALIPHLEAIEDTIRRSAIFILWKREFADVSAAVEPLQNLLKHKEDVTRGMAALALGQHRVSAAFEALAKMAKEDPSGYARRCAVHALGALGDVRAEPILQAALNDAESFVRQNAKAALELLNAAKAAPARGEATRQPNPSEEVRDTAQKFAAAMGERNDQQLRALSSDSLTKGWTDAVPHFADELRTAVTHLGAGFDVFARIEEVLVEGDLAAVKTAHVPQKKAYLVLFFHKTPDGWRNCSLRNSPETKPLSEHLQKLAADMRSKSAGAEGGGTGAARTDSIPGLNDDQRAILEWTERQFRSFFDRRTFDGWSADERTNLEKRSIDALDGPRSTEYYQAINTLAALRSTNALPRLRKIALERVDKDNRDRWMSIRALGIIGDKSAVPELIHLVYHGNVNTRWWAQISLVRLTGQNFAKDWNAWGDWWNKQSGQPPFEPEIIRWWNGQAEPDKLAESIEEGDRNFLEKLRPAAAK